MTHTPGPWIASGREEADAAIFIHARDGIRTVATVPLSWTGAPQYAEADAEQTANANLITAAPELLDALKKLGMGTPDGYCFCDPESPLAKPHPQWCRNAGAAIAKAEGK